MPKVSVIIPVYKAEPYIEKCARSLFEQTLDSIEYIFINDSTPDKSMEVLNRVVEDYPQRKEQIKILHHDINKGISTTRNTGLKNATSDFIIHCDSDDWVDADLYEKLYNKAVEDKADVVMCDHKIIKNEDSKIIIQFFDKNNKICLKALLTAKLSPFLWNKLIKKKLYEDNQIHFPDGINIREDFYVLIKLFYFATKISKISDAYYYYRIHDYSISRAFRIDENPDFWESRIKASELAYDFLESAKGGMNFKQDILNSKLILKKLLILSSTKNTQLRKIFPESNSNIFKSNLPFSHKLIIWSSVKGYFLFPFLKFLSKVKNRIN